MPPFPAGPRTGKAHSRRCGTRSDSPRPLRNPSNDIPPSAFLIPGFPIPVSGFPAFRLSAHGVPTESVRDPSSAPRAAFRMFPGPRNPPTFHSHPPLDQQKRWAGLTDQTTHTSGTVHRSTSAVNSFTEWDPLREVVVGTLAGGVFPTWQDAMTHTVPESAHSVFRERGGTPFPAAHLEAPRRNWTRSSTFSRRKESPSSGPTRPSTGGRSPRRTGSRRAACTPACRGTC